MFFAGVEEYCRSSCTHASERGRAKLATRTVHPGTAGDAHNFDKWAVNDEVALWPAKLYGSPSGIGSWEDTTQPKGSLGACFYDSLLGEVLSTGDAGIFEIVAALAYVVCMQ